METKQDSTTITDKVKVIGFGIVLMLCTLGSLPLFAVFASQFEYPPIAITVGFGGWALWCVLVMAGLKKWDEKYD